MLSLARKHWRFFPVATAAAIAVRAFFVINFRLIDGDSLIYGDIAKNWLTHGVFGVTTTAGPVPTWIRLPGYPAFLAAIWAVVGVEHYNAVLIAQLLIDVVTCFLVADLARRIVRQSHCVATNLEWRAARTAFLLTAFCPFIAIFTASPLSETLAIFCAALALDAAAAGFDDLPRGRVRAWILCGVAVAIGILLRPDGGIILAAIGAWMGWHLLRAARHARTAATEPYQKSRVLARNIVTAGLIVAGIALVPLVPWTIRNWRDFHQFQPLAPRYANAPDEPVDYGYQRWTKTWMVDYVSVTEVYWQLGDQPIDVALLPDRAFDSPQEREQTAAIFSAYNDRGQWTEDMDASLNRIAKERIARAPLRYYVWLPAARIADMWLRPRTELTRLNDRWWQYEDDPTGAAWGTTLGIVNLLFVAAALYALARRRRLRFLGLLLTFVILRSVFLGSLENPEPRYTLECYPVMLALAGTALTRMRERRPIQDESVLNVKAAL